MLCKARHGIGLVILAACLNWVQPGRLEEMQYDCCRYGVVADRLVAQGEAPAT
jgi:hypothetical protein